MKDIIINENYIIKYDELNIDTYIIHFSSQNYHIINSIIKTYMLQGATSTNNYKILKFKALSIKTFKQYQQDHKKKYGKINININNIFNMITTLVSQLNYLIKNTNHTFIGYNIENIIVINDNKFIYLGNEYLTEIQKEMITITCPFDLEDLVISPELMKIKEIPSNIHYKTTYYSLGYLLIYALSSSNDYFLIKGTISDDKIKEILNSLHIKGTKLYWLISRCLENDPTRRSIVYI